jgi:leader peptidase (prepilin peptidase)/N-methyltransferase
MTVTLLGLIFILGLLIGSFLNVVIYRTPLGESIVLPASKCPQCHTPLKWYHNIPLLSWVFLGGKCGFCKQRISIQYPFIELMTALLFVVLYLHSGLTWYLPFIWGSFATLFALSMIDFKYMAVPDSLNIAALLFALCQPHFLEALLHAAIAMGGLYLIGLFSSWLAKREALGGADVIVAGTMGALLGFPLFFIALFISALLAMIPALFYREQGIPFVPFLALATLVTYLYEGYLLKLLWGGGFYA